MEIKDRRLFEILIGFTFLIGLLLVVFLVISISNPASTTTTTITNSFNTYNIQTTYEDTSPNTYRYYRYSDYHDRDYHRDYLRYSDRGDRDVYEGVFGNDIDRYEVYVKNREYVNGNFRVTFYFEDYRGDVERRSFTKYIPAREERLFSIKDVSPERYKYERWWYEVDSLTER